MKILPKLLFFYSAIASFFIAVSLTLTSKSLIPVVFALLFLPVAGYFVTELFKELKSENDTSFSPKKGEFIAMAVVFLILLGIGVKNISSSKKNVEVKSESMATPAASSSGLIFKVNTTPQAQVLKLTVSIADGSESVNIREKPTVYSKLLVTAKNGDTFEYTKKENGWYEIVLPTGGTGHLSVKYGKEEVK